MTAQFNSLDDVAAAFALPTRSETEALFLQGAVIKSAVEQGFDVDETSAYCGNVVGRSKKTVYRRYSVARTFPQYTTSIVWEMYAVASDVVDYRCKDANTIALQQAKAQEWLLKARAEQWSTRQLRQAIAKRRVTDRIVLLDNIKIFAIDMDDFGGGMVTLKLDIDSLSPQTMERLNNISQDGVIFATIVQEVPKVENLEAA